MIRYSNSHIRHVPHKCIYIRLRTLGSHHAFRSIEYICFCLIAAVTSYLNSPRSPVIGTQTSTRMYVVREGGLGQDGKKAIVLTLGRKHIQRVNQFTRARLSDYSQRLRKQNLRIFLLNHTWSNMAVESRFHQHQLPSDLLRTLVLTKSSQPLAARQQHQRLTNLAHTAST